MSKPNDDLTKLIERLNEGQITPEQFERESAELIDSLGIGAEATPVDPVKRERIDAAATIVRNL